MVQLGMVPESSMGFRRGLTSGDTAGGGSPFSLAAVDPAKVYPFVGSMTLDFNQKVED